jgi:hypothetical protein
MNKKEIEEIRHWIDNHPDNIPAAVYACRKQRMKWEYKYSLDLVYLALVANI